MNNNLFISRCEIILVTMKGGNFSSITSKQVAKWLNIEEATASQVIAKACKYNILKKEGAASKTCYKLTIDCYNSLESKSNASGVGEAAKYVAEWFVTHPSNKNKVKEVVTESGKKLVKVQTVQELDEEANLAINKLMDVINQNKELRAEVELLREEIERLRVIEDKYKQIKSLTK